MRVTRETEEQYERNNDKMNRLNSNFRKYMWASLFLGVTIFLSSFMAGALSSAKGGQHGAGIFYYSMSAGVFQILLGLGTVILSYIASGKKRVASLILLGVDLISAVAILLGINGTFAAANLLFLAVGIGLNVWAQFLFNADQELREQPGYPLFSLNADMRAEYEESADVVARRANASDHMETIGTPLPQIDKPIAVPMPPQERDASGAPKPLGPTPSIRLPEQVNVSGPVNLADLTTPGGTVRSTAPQPQTPQQPAAPAPVTLDSLDTGHQQKEAALPQVNAADMLADMTAIPSHATQQGNPDMLPTPEEVRARLAAMKQARNDHPAES